MTEEEAKTKWCPMVRAGLFGANMSASVNRPADPEKRVHDLEWAKCIGSGCMMWRTTTRWKSPPGGMIPISYEPGEGLTILVEAETDGHCGLGAKP